MAKSFFERASKAIGKNLTKFGQSSSSFKSTRFEPGPANFSKRVDKVEGDTPEFGYASAQFKKLVDSHERMLQAAKGMAETGSIKTSKGNIVL